jgi:hypothetical protein
MNCQSGLLVPALTSKSPMRSITYGTLSAASRPAAGRRLSAFARNSRCQPIAALISA